MNIGDKITLRAKVLDFGSNPHGASVKVEIRGFVDSGYVDCERPFSEPVRLWIYREDVNDIITEGR